MSTSIASTLYESATYGYDTYLQYRNDALPATSFIWGPDNWDFGRLPANISIFDFLIEQSRQFTQWLSDIGYTGETILFCPTYPDEIMTLAGTAAVTADSPHSKVPYTIAYEITRHEPDSKGTQPFNGSGKDAKLNDLGEFKDPDTGLVYQLFKRDWESLVTYTCIGRSNYETEWLTHLFEVFCTQKESGFLKAGVEKCAPCGRIKLADPILDPTGILYRKTLMWYRTDEFMVRGPITEFIASVDVEVNRQDAVEAKTATVYPKTDATVLSVDAGNLLTVSINGTAVKVKTIGVSCPELNETDTAKAQAMTWNTTVAEIITRGADALAYTVSLLEIGAPVQLETDTTLYDLNGVMLAYVYLNEYTMLNEVLLAQGMGWFSASYTNTRYNARFKELTKMTMPV